MVLYDYEHEYYEDANLLFEQMIYHIYSLLFIIFHTLFQYKHISFVKYVYSFDVVTSPSIIILILIIHTSFVLNTFCSAHNWHLYWIRFSLWFCLCLRKPDIVVNTRPQPGKVHENFSVISTYHTLSRFRRECDNLCWFNERREWNSLLQFW